MKWILAAVLAIILLLPITVEAANKKKGGVRFTAGTAGGTTVIAATYSYTIINDTGGNTFFWNCTGETVGIAATDAGVRTGESIEIPIPCHTMTWDTTTGNTDIRIIYIK